VFHCLMELDALARLMVERHILYGEAVREFKKAFMESSVAGEPGHRNPRLSLQ